jgi:hypothetical protein
MPLNSTAIPTRPTGPQTFNLAGATSAVKPTILEDKAFDFCELSKPFNFRSWQPAGLVVGCADLKPAVSFA